ncbi:MAG: phosphate uptake regulator PhoU [Candidatus Bathyarchaeia archaeon]|nr:phosphate uptake regulator PhoU [Candidatus Bathyarchaeota archaeon]
MEIRKVQRVGRSTITVSLPNEWVKEQGIRPKDILFLIPEKDGSLKIMPRHVAQREEADEYIVNADACDEPGMLERIIVGSYILGRDVIRVISANRIGKNHVDEVRRIVQKLIGLGILEETPKNILLQCSIDVTKFKLDMLIRRLALIASTILSEAMLGFKDKNYDLVEEAIAREDEADKIYYLAVRLLLSAQVKPAIAEEIGMVDVIFIPAARLILQYLELVADYSEDLAREVLEMEVYRNRLHEDFINRMFHLSELTQTILQKSIECLFARDLKVANQLLELRKTLEIESNRLMREAPEIPYIRSILSCLSKIADKGATIAEIAINRALEDPSKYAGDVVRAVKHVRTLPLTIEKK